MVVGRRTRAVGRAVAERVDTMVSVLRAVVVALIGLTVAVVLLAARA